jgi:hemoglobin-like flavoprotein
VTPEQISLVEESLASIELDDLAHDFYERAFERSPELMAMFTTDATVQRARFAAELREIVRTISAFNEFDNRTRALGLRHRSYGVRAPHYVLMGDALLDALSHAMGPRWTDDMARAWTLAYNLTAQTMMLGAMEEADSN